MVYGAGEVAALLGVSSRLVHELRVRDKHPLPSVQPMGPGGRVLFPKAAVEAWLLEETTDPTRGWSSAEVVQLREVLRLDRGDR